MKNVSVARGLRALCLAALATTTLPSGSFAAAGYRLIGWNNLGMHCMDSEFSEFSLLPPYNTINAQLVDPQGNLLRNPGAITVTYEAVADPSGSINTTSDGKTDFWQYVGGLFGAPLSVDQGLAGSDMPGAANVAQPMQFDPANAWFIGEGIPLTPYDDAGRKNTYPLMRLVARDGSGAVLASTDVVAPVSDEMSCVACHASNSSAAARPASGWVGDPDIERDYRMNILRLHDDREGALPSFKQALADVGYNPAGLEATVVEDGRSVLCAACHLSEALPGSGRPGIAPLTQAIHRSMAYTVDPRTGMALDSVDNRTACYSCHPGSATRCLRGAMGAAVATDGTLAMQCQSCHGRMMDVASPQRTGWFDEPRCDSCHTGTAMSNNGAIRFESVFNSDGSVRRAVNATFATNDNTPVAGVSLYRFSTGHGGLQCSACHGSTHAVFPSSHDNDNLQNIALQGHKGVLSDCGTCHAQVPQTVNGGPHGMHPIGAQWVSRHGDAAEHGSAACRGCHGSDYRGTVLSRALGDRVFSTEFGTKKFWRGAQIGCYACHRGPGSESRNSNRAPVVQDQSVSATANTPLPVALVAGDADGDALTLRIVSQPQHGTVGILGAKATYYPDGTEGVGDSFTFAAWDGSIDSNLGMVSVNVGGAQCAPGCDLPGGGCDPACGATDTHDAAVRPVRPKRVVIKQNAASVGKSVDVVVRSLDPAGSVPQTVQLEALDGDCPAGTIDGLPSFRSGSAGTPDTANLDAGGSAVARVRMVFAAADFTTPNRRAPQRCTVILRVSPLGATDPTPDNNEMRLEINVHDRNDLAKLADAEAFISSLAPVSLEIPAFVATDSVSVVGRVAMLGPQSGAGVSVRVLTDDGTCPPGTLGAVDLDASLAGAQDTVLMGRGQRRKASLQIRATAAAFSTPAGPARCSAVVSVSYSGPGGDVSNDSTVLQVTVLDRNDM